MLDFFASNRMAALAGQLFNMGNNDPSPATPVAGQEPQQLRIVAPNSPRNSPLSGPGGPPPPLPRVSGAPPNSPVWLGTPPPPRWTRPYSPTIPEMLFGRIGNNGNQDPQQFIRNNNNRPIYASPDPTNPVLVNSDPTNPSGGKRRRYRKRRTQKRKASRKSTRKNRRKN